MREKIEMPLDLCQPAHILNYTKLDPSARVVSIVPLYKILLLLPWGEAKNVHDIKNYNRTNSAQNKWVVVLILQHNLKI